MPKCPFHTGMSSSELLSHCFLELKSLFLLYSCWWDLPRIFFKIFYFSSVRSSKDLYCTRNSFFSVVVLFTRFKFQNRLTFFGDNNNNKNTLRRIPQIYLGEFFSGYTSYFVYIWQKENSKWVTKWQFSDIFVALLMIKHSRTYIP